MDYSKICEVYSALEETGSGLEKTDISNCFTITVRFAFSSAMPFNGQFTSLLVGLFPNCSANFLKNKVGALF